MDLDVRQLRAVVTVADVGSFTGAAAALHVAQSSLSRTVLDVERRLGVDLFERTTRRVLLTADGREFVTLARRVVEELDGALSHFEGYLAGTQGTVSVAVLPSLAATMLPAVLAPYRRARPDVHVVVQDGLAAETLGRVRAGGVDLALVVTDSTPPGTESTPIAADRFHCVFTSGHRFAALEEVRWADLEGEPVVAFDPTSSIRAYTEQALAGAGVRVGAVTEARNVGAVAGLVGAGLGVSAVPALVLPMMGFADLEHRPLVGPAVERDIRLVRDPRRPVPPAVSALLEMLLDGRARGFALPPGARWVVPGGRSTPR